MDNYRGITVSSILGKLFETVLLNRLDELNNDQSELQYGFTKGLSPTMASLVLSEAVLDSSLTGEPLYIAALDTQKAFDVVSHPVLMRCCIVRVSTITYGKLLGRCIMDLLPTKSNGKVRLASLLVSYNGCVKGDPINTFLQDIFE